MRVGGAVVRGAGDDGRGGFVGHVVDGERVFVVAVADVVAEVAGVGTTVGEALGLDGLGGGVS